MEKIYTNCDSTSSVVETQPERYELAASVILNANVELPSGSVVIQIQWPQSLKCTSIKNLDCIVASPLLRQYSSRYPPPPRAFKIYPICGQRYALLILRKVLSKSIFSLFTLHFSLSDSVVNPFRNLKVSLLSFDRLMAFFNMLKYP